MNACNYSRSRFAVVLLGIVCLLIDSMAAVSKKGSPPECDDKHGKNNENLQHKFY